MIKISAASSNTSYYGGKDKPSISLLNAAGNTVWPRHSPVATGASRSAAFSITTAEVKGGRMRPSSVALPFSVKKKNRILKYNVEVFVDFNETFSKNVFSRTLASWDGNRFAICKTKLSKEN